MGRHQDRLHVRRSRGVRGGEGGGERGQARAGDRGGVRGFRSARARAWRNGRRWRRTRNPSHGYGRHRVRARHGRAGRTAAAQGGRMRVCKTPGAIYRTEIKAGSVSVTVTLPEKLKGLLDHLLCAQAKSPAQVYEEILHDAMEDAVAKILAHNASRP